MTNDLLPLSTIDMNVENLTNIDHQPLIHENDTAISVPQSHEQKLSSPYLMLSVGDNRHFGLSDFQDPLFSQQPLHFHYNQSIRPPDGSGYETGDQARLTNEIKFNEYRKQKSVSSRKYQTNKSRSTHRPYTNSRKSKNKMIKAKEKKKKVSRRNTKKRKHTIKKISRTNTQQLRYQSKPRQAILVKRRRYRQQMLLKKKKEIFKQRTASKKRSMAKVNKNKSVTSSQHARKLNMMNHRMASTISSRQSSTSRLTRTPSVTQSKTEIESNKIKRRVNVSTLDPILQSINKQMMNVTLAPMNKSDADMIKPIDINNDNINTKTSPSLFSLKNSLINKQSSASTVMPLIKHTAQLTSMNNNKHILKMKRRRRSSKLTISGRKLKERTRRGMTLRSRTIIINNNKSTKL